MSRVSEFGLVCLLLSVSVCEMFYEDTTVNPDYDENSTFYYSFYSNTSQDELEKFLDSSDWANGAASLPVCPDVWTLLWTLMVLILNAPRIQFL